jgi:hypothetical protein
MLKFSKYLNFAFCTILVGATTLTSSLNAVPAFRKTPTSSVEINEPSAATFTPPSGWKMADQSDLSPHVKILVVGPKLKSDMPPTMNLMIEPFNGTQKDYLKNVKKINESHGDEWKDLGNLKTKAGDANLSQVEIRSKWGGEKLMHAILVRNGYAYVLTATASKNEFGKFYQQFYTALRSLQIHSDLLDIIKDSTKREQLKSSIDSVKTAYNKALGQTSSQDRATKEQVFYSSDFQDNYWRPFEDMLKTNFSDLGDEWKSAVSNDLQGVLLNI